ncbi:MAG: hypothetical protein WDW38_009075 [Sanguina aurantia]
MVSSAPHAASTADHSTSQLAPSTPASSSTATTTATTAALTHSSNIITVLRSRGLLQDVTSDGLEALVSTTSVSVYCGFDPTADSLHLGNLLGILVLSWFQRCGHSPVALLGGATGRVGDPSGRSSERPVLSEEEIERNVSAIGGILKTILARNSEGLASTAAAAAAASPESHPSSTGQTQQDRDRDTGSSGSSSGSGSASASAKVLNNLEWFGSMSFLGFLRDIGKFARVGTMLAKDSVKTRLESDQGISFTEFTYQLLQGYDFVHLYREHGVRVQVGGSDQWGNITAGTDLLRRLLGGEGIEAPACYGLVFPLLVDAEGKKFGKSVGGAIWLSPARLSPYKFYQYMFSTADADVLRFLKMLTFLPLERVGSVGLEMQAPGYLKNSAQRLLAEEVTRFVHGEEGLRQALRATEALKPGSSTQLDAVTLEAVAGDAPTSSLPREQVVGAGVVELLVAVGLQASKGAARKLIKGGGVYLNNQRVESESAVVDVAQLIDGRMLLLATGKKNKMLITLL